MQGQPPAQRCPPREPGGGAKSSCRRCRGLCGSSGLDDPPESGVFCLERPCPLHSPPTYISHLAPSAAPTVAYPNCSCLLPGLLALPLTATVCFAHRDQKETLKSKSEILFFCLNPSSDHHRFENQVQTLPIPFGAPAWLSKRASYPPLSLPLLQSHWLPGCL